MGYYLTEADEKRLNFQWSEDGSRLWCGDSAFNTVMLFNVEDDWRASELGGLFKYGCEDYYTRFLSEAVLASLRYNDSFYSACMALPELLNNLVLKVHEAHSGVDIMPAEIDIWSSVTIATPYREKPLELTYQLDNSMPKKISHIATAGAELNFYEGGVSASFYGQKLFMSFVAPESSNLKYSTEAILCSRLLLRKIGAVDYVTAPAHLARVSEILRYCTK